MIAFLAWSGAFVARAEPAVSETLIPPRFGTPVFSPAGDRLATPARDEKGRRYIVLTECATLRSTHTAAAAINDERRTELKNVLAFAWVGNDHLALITDVNPGTDTFQFAKVGRETVMGGRHDARYALVGAVPNSTAILVATRPLGDAVGPCRVLRLDAAAADRTDEVFRCESRTFEAVADRSGELALVKRDTVPGGEPAWFARQRDTAEWRQLKLPHWNRVFAFDFKPDLLLVGGHFDGPAPGIHFYNIAEDRAVRALALNKRYAMDQVSTPQFCEALRSLVGLAFDGDVPAPQWFHPDFVRLQTSIDKAFPDSRNPIVAWSPDLKRMVVERLFPNQPSRYFLVDNEKGTLSLLATNGGTVDPSTTATQEVVVVANRDGFKLTGYLTKPAKPADTRLPLVVLIGPDPWNRRNRYGWDNQAQYLAEAGLATLRLNTRGSANLLGEGRIEWKTPADAQKPFDDLADAIDFLAREKAIDPARVAVVGLGGAAGWMAAYAPMALPGRVKCIGALAGTYDLEAYRKDKDVREMGGIPFADAGSPFSADDLKSLSPAQQTARGTASAFLAYGQWSPPRVIAEADRFARRLSQAGASVAEPFSGPFWGAGLDDEANLQAVFAELRTFLRKRL